MAHQNTPPHFDESAPQVARNSDTTAGGPRRQRNAATTIVFVLCSLSSGVGCGEDSGPQPERRLCAAAAIYDCLGFGSPPATDVEALALCFRWRRFEPGLQRGYGSTRSSYVYEGDDLVEIVSECGVDSGDGLFRMWRTGDGATSLGWQTDPLPAAPDAPPAGLRWDIGLEDGAPTTGVSRRDSQESPLAEFSFTQDPNERLLEMTSTVSYESRDEVIVVSVSSYRHVWSADGRLDRVEWEFDGENGPLADAVTYEYEDGRLIATRSDQFVQTHRWEDGLLVETQSVDDNQGEYTIRNEYEGDRLVTQTVEKAGFGLWNELFVTYDDRGRIATRELIVYDPPSLPSAGD